MGASKSQRKTSTFIILFALFWTVIVSCFDIFLGHALYNQIRARNFAQAEGRILSSKVTENSDSDGTTYGAEVRYEYTVDGRRYESDRVRYGAMSTSDGEWASQTVRENPTGSVRPVYYDPQNPTRAVLQTGVGGQNWFMLLFMSPFNAVMIFLWWMVVAGRRPSPPAGGARIVPDGDCLLVCFKTVSRAAKALLSFGGVTFAGIFLIAFTTGFSGDSTGTLTVFGLAIATAAWAGLKPSGPIKPDLIIDPIQGRLELPGGAGLAGDWKAWRAWKKAGKPPFVIPLESLRAVVMNERVKDDGDGKSINYVVTLHLADPAAGETTEHDIGQWMIPNRAESFTTWLRDTLGVRNEA